MTDQDVQRLVKFLNLTTSENDHEALIAMRKANALLKQHNKSWNDMYKVEKSESWTTIYPAQSQAEAIRRQHMEDLLRRQAYQAAQNFARASGIFTK